MSNALSLESVPFTSAGGNDEQGFLFSFGAYGSTHLAVLADSVEDALESALEWLDDNAPGLLSTVGPDDYARAAAELGAAWEPEEMSDSDTARVYELAEADMTMVSHTTLKNGNCIPSWEWTARELDASELAVIAARATMEEWLGVA